MCDSNEIDCAKLYVRIWNSFYIYDIFDITYNRSIMNLLRNNIFLHAVARSASLDKERFAAVRARAGRRTRSEKYGRNTVQESLFESDPALFKR